MVSPFNTPPVLAITPGEPAGIGPDITLMLAQEKRSVAMVAIADTGLLEQRAQTLGLPLKIQPFDKATTPTSEAHALCVADTPLVNKAIPGKLDPENSAYVLATLKRAVDGCMNGDFNAMVTAPVHKGVINDAGIAFTGHTEFIAERTQASPVMMLVAGSLRVALATTHLPLSKVAQAINEESLTRVIRILNDDLKSKFKLSKPRILVCGLNPHAGEGGHLGHEEIDTIIPALEKLRQENINLTGPLPADTLFTPRHLENADAVLAMYHDQGLPVLKYAGFGSAVNLTLGLPLIRTSVDHGTALDLAGTSNIETGSMKAALELARQLGEPAGHHHAPSAQ